MAFPPQYREPAPEFPAIRTHAPDPFRTHSHREMAFPRSHAVSIPGVEMKHEAPPALPPPTHPPIEGVVAPFPPFDMRERRDHESGFRSLRSGLSGYGSIDSSYNDERPNFKRRDTGSTNGDEGYASYSTDRSRDSFPTQDFGLFHSKLHMPSPADVHSDSMKKKLDPIRTSDRSPSTLSSSLSDLFPRRNIADARFTPALSLPVQLPIHSRSCLDSPNRLVDTPIFSALSPRSAPFSTPSHPRSPNDVADPSRSPQGRTSRHNSDDGTSTHGGSEYHGVEDMEIDETSSLKRLHIEDGQGSVRQKRRTGASPPVEDYAVHGMAGQPDLLRRQETTSQRSPTPRLYTLAQTAPVPTVSRSNSYMSTSPRTHSSTASVTLGRRSPGELSPGATSPTSSTSPYNTTMSLNTSPRGSISSQSTVHNRAVSTSGPRKLEAIPKTSGSKLQDFFMCECCPKKPKKFETAEELKAHAAEKQYGCNYCGNRFKNKNEAERHQNSLHVRRHSWSCSALSGYDRAFHESPNMPGQADACGYCGEEFPRTGHNPSGGLAPRQTSEQDWEDRIEHLQVVHKFRECNSTKKFFRADHFRQHLKHSHAGFSGKWTNMLENACMIEEEPPTPR